MEFVYVVEVGNTAKIGYTTNPKRRMKQIEHDKGAKIVSSYYEQAERDTERMLHHHFKNKCVGGEYFDVSFSEAKEALIDCIQNPIKYRISHPAQKYTESKKASNRKWDAENLDRLSFTMKKGSLDAVRRCAAATGESVNKYLGRIVQEAISGQSNPVSNGDLSHTVQDATKEASSATADAGTEG